MEEHLLVNGIAVELARTVARVLIPLDGYRKPKSQAFYTKVHFIADNMAAALRDVEMTEAMMLALAWQALTAMRDAAIAVEEPFYSTYFDEPLAEADAFADKMSGTGQTEYVEAKPL